MRIISEASKIALHKVELWVELRLKHILHQSLFKSTLVCMEERLCLHVRSIVNAIFRADPAVRRFPRVCRRARVRTRAVDRNTQPDSSGCGPDSAGFAVVFVVFFLGACPLHRTCLIDVRVDAVITDASRRPPSSLLSVDGNPNEGY